MEFALKLVLKSKGKHMLRTAKSYKVDVKSLVKRYNDAIKDEADGPTGRTHRVPLFGFSIQLLE